MAEQEFLLPRTEPHESDEHIVEVATKPIDIADLLDQIDGVLEKNAQEFVDNFVQKGGQ
jgi:ubiquitin-like protein Pup